MMEKKAQGMSLKVIIIAVLALIILVVLVLVFTGKLKMFGSTTSDTTSAFGADKCAVPGTNNECMDESECQRQGGSYNRGPDEGYSDCFGGGCCFL